MSESLLSTGAVLLMVVLMCGSVVWITHADTQAKIEIARIQAAACDAP